MSGMEVAKTASEVVDVVRALPSDHRSITTPRNIAKHHNSLQILGGYAVHPADSHLDPVSYTHLTLRRARFGALESSFMLGGRARAPRISDVVVFEK